MYYLVVYLKTNNVSEQIFSFETDFLEILHNILWQNRFWDRQIDYTWLIYDGAEVVDCKEL